MSRLETDLRSTGLHSRGMSSGLAIHERERKEAQRERAKLRRSASNTSDRPLFAEPRKVQPSGQDALQQKIQATLGTYDTIAPVLQHHNHLIGIPRLPPTPVEGQKFVFDRHKGKDAKLSPKNHKLNGVINGTGHLATKSPLVKSNNTIAPTKNSTLTLSKSPTRSNEAIAPKTADTRKVPSNVKSPTPKEAAVSKQNSSKKTLTPVKEATAIKTAESKKSSSQLKSPTHKDSTPTKSAEMKRTEIKPVVNGNIKSQQNFEKEKDKLVSKVKGIKDEKSLAEDLNSDQHKSHSQKSSAALKGKPPKIKLSMPDRNLPVSSVKQENLSMSDQPTNVEKIIEEMQQVAPPLTGIHTPIKGGSSIFAFHHNSIQEHSVLPALATKRNTSESIEGKKESGNDVVLLDDDLVLTDDSDDEHEHPVTSTSPSKDDKTTRHRSHSTSSSGSSSEDSDSDSSDSDSDSDSDSNNNTKDKDKSGKSPVHEPSSSPKHTSGRNWGLNHFANALNQSSPSQTTKTKPSPSAANTVGGDGVRGNQVAPAANKSCLNSHVAKSPVAPVSEESFLPFAEGLPDLSPDLNRGVDIESLTAKLDLPLPTDLSVDSAEPVGTVPVENNVTNVKTQQPKDDKKVKRRSSNVESKLNTSQEKVLTKNSPKKPIKSKQTDSLKNSTYLKVSNPGSDDVVKKATKTTKTPNGMVTKKSFKKKSETKGVSKTVVSNEPVKETSEVDEEDVFVDIVSVEPSPGIDNKKVEAKQTTKSKETENPKGVKKKPVTTNGLSKHVNGDGLLSSLISTNGNRDILGKNVEITYDEVNKPESLIVKIDLSLLKRIPRLPSNDQPKHSVSPPKVETNGSRDGISSPEVKIRKRKLSEAKSIEQDVSKKVKNKSDVDSNRTKPHEQSLTSSSNNSHPSKDGMRKRSPSQEKDTHRIKRQRQDNENSIDHNSLSSFQNGSVNENGMDVVGNGVIPHICLCNKTSDAEKKRETDIARFYDAEPKVPYGPDHYLGEAKRLKHKADSSTDKDAKAYLYVEAVLNFARCGKAIEQNEESESRSAFQMYSETLDLLRYTMRNFVNRYTHRSDRVPDKRLSVLCMRIQSLLYMRLYKLRKDGVMKNVKMVTEHFRGPPKSTQAPSPYTSNTKTTGTPSPMSPTPSPSGSVGSVGSSGSNETMTTPSRNGKPSTGSNAMTSPVNVCMPQKIHSLTQQQILVVNNLVYSQDLWDQAQPLVLEFRDFFMDLDRNCGPLTLHSSIVHLCGYIQEGLRRLQESLQSEKASNCKAVGD